MYRRGFLQGAVAASAAAGMGWIRISTSSAARPARFIQQATSAYELVDLWPQTDLAYENGQAFRGAARGIANDGTTIGQTVIDGVMRAVTWQPDGAMSLLDMSNDPSISSQAVWGNSNGRCLGNTWQTGSPDSKTNALWQDGMQLTEGLPASYAEPGTYIGSINDNGFMVGEVAQTAARWTGEQLELLPVQPGYAGGGARALREDGTAAGTLWQLPGYQGIPAPFVWGVDGSVRVLESSTAYIPAEMNRFRVYWVDENGGLVANALQNGLQPDYLVRYSDGMQTPIADLSGEGATLTGANAAGTLVGHALLGGIPVPTIWVNDQPSMLADLIVPGPDRLLTAVYAINDSGMMVGDAQDSAGTVYSVLLNPV